MVFSSFKDSGRGGWYPSQGVYTLFDHAGVKPSQIVKLMLDKIEFPDAISEDHFQIGFPPGTRITDHSSKL